MSMASDQYIAYFPDYAHSLCQRFVKNTTRRDALPDIQFFLAHYRAFPCVLKCTVGKSNDLYHNASILHYLHSEFNHEPKNDVVIQKFHQKSKQFYATLRLCDLQNGIIIYMKHANLVFDVDNPNNCIPDLMDDYFLVSKQILVYHLPDVEKQAHDVAREITKRIVFLRKTLRLRLICSRPQAGLCLKCIQLRKPLIYDLALHYGEKFVQVHESILKNLNKTDGHGIVLLHGLPGSGKTHYIRYLIGEIDDKSLIYLPPDMAKDLTKPEVLTFLLGHPNSILVIEDAENIIGDRSEQVLNMNQAVANILNLSDGLLGDAIHMQIIATFNCDLTVVDKALLRKGRLIAQYNFGKLDVNSAKILSTKLGFGVENITAPMTLAEIYNQEKEEENDTLV
ncbi:unnamed protein product [Adineta ricciae]|uniref:ATPase AAA-type core domain-containing protein n=1 Tax=Adineta ricciae TaxID=249248 RepID=A0A813VWT7_ADIRI|nr:unnamed protein product [Adineta ricciae]CAF1077653.1 unnamed protein product [Adineta ricciae]